MKNASRETSKSWLIAGICCFINFLHLGIARQSGLLYLAAMEKYNANRNQASLPFVLCYTVRNVSGPFVGFLGRKVGLERVTIFGCFLASVGMAACFWAEDILTVTVLWGGVFGLGFGMGSVLIPVVLNQHFDKHLSNANGIAFGGECVAGFILPILVKILLNAFGTSGLLLILSGLMLHSVPAAMLLKMSSSSKPSKSHEQKPVWVHHASSDAVLFSSVNGVYNKPFNIEDYNKAFQTDSTNVSNNTNKTTLSNETLKGNNYIYNNLVSENNIGYFARDCYQRDVDLKSDDLKLHHVIYGQHSKGVIATQTMLKCPDTIQNGIKCRNSESSLTTIPCNGAKKVVGTESTDCKLPHVLYGQHSSGEIASKTILKCPDTIQNGIKNHTSESYLPTIQCNGTNKSSVVESSKSSSAFSSFRVFYDPAFILMLLTQSSFIFIGTMVMTIIVDLSRDAGVTSDEEIYILMCLSVSDMIGRFGLGWVTDSGYMSTVTFSALCYFSLGIILTALVFLKGFVLIMCAAFFIGLFLGGLLIVCPGVVSDHIEKEKITMALASRFVLYAPMSLTQSSLIGFFRGTKGSYNGILYMLTAVCLLCCAMSLSIPFVTRIRERRNATKAEIQKKGKS